MVDLPFEFGGLVWFWFIRLFVCLLACRIVLKGNKCVSDSDFLFVFHRISKVTIDKIKWNGMVQFENRMVYFTSSIALFLFLPFYMDTLIYLIFNPFENYFNTNPYIYISVYSFTFCYSILFKPPLLRFYYQLFVIFATSIWI